MATVQEMILAAQAQQKKHPLSALAELINAASSGYSEGSNLRNLRSETDLRRAEIAKRLIETKQLEDEMRAQEELRRQFQEKLALTAEQNLRTAQAGVAKPKTEMTPAGKFTEEWTQDSKGKVSRTIKEVSPTPPKPATSIEEGLMEKVNRGEMTLEQAIALKGKPVLDKSMQAAITKAKVELAEARPVVDSVITDVARVRELNKSSYGGYYGAAKMKVKSAMDVDAKSDPQFTNTAEVINTLQALVTKVLKTTFGGQLSDSERAYLDKVYGAAATLSRAERDIAINRIEKMMTDKMTAAQSKYDELLLGAGMDPEQPTGKAVVEPKKIKVIRLSDNAPGTINESDYDPAKYKRVP